ncbi:DUF2947 family protein [Ferrimonas lipolytica]|uniref:DUF2947 family protein n=1 Tax=Ferrimonas lipolytica TaxID=2724191 RepID=A0A6H1U9M2_9GAMM|nr:DUF2947 family protein [Ferrimonas lipolytica]QIZ75528.1 DUF2947 family protein [Ferrimonas lipolytica]
MNYIELQDYPLHWVYKRADMGITEADLATIKPMTSSFANQVWQRDISAEAIDLDRLEDSDWLSDNSHWPKTENWERAFDSEEQALPETLAGHLNWDPQTVVFVCYDAEHIIETRYGTLQRNWKAFLFAAEQALVLGRRRKEALWFIDESKVKLGQRD